MDKENIRLNRSAIKNHLQAIHSVSATKRPDCYLMLGSYGEDPIRSAELSSYHRYYQVNEYEQMTEDVIRWSLERHRNVYLSYGLYSADLGRKAKESDVNDMVGIVLDFDDVDARNYRSRLPLKPDLVVETSPGRFQASYFIEDPIAFDLAKQFATALTDKSKADFCSKNLAQVWRIAGTLNWPNEKKVREGRPEEPYLANFKESPCLS
jgi:hypothetical protein